MSVGMEAAQQQHKTETLAALIENRAREVGLAVLDLRTSSLHLSQYIETSRSYQNTIALLDFFEPDVIIMSAKRTASEVITGLKNVVDSVNARKGAIALQNFATLEGNAVSSENYHKQYYLCLGAAAAVFSWTEQHEGFVIIHNSLKVVFDGSLNHMSIDATSIVNLEVIRPLHRELHQQDQDAKKKCLYGMLNTTKTNGGYYQRPDELTTNEELFFGLSDVLQKFPKDADNILCNFCIKKKHLNDLTGSTDPRKSQSLIKAIILLQKALDLLPMLLEVLQRANSTLLCNIRVSLESQSGYSRLHESIASSISADTLYGRTALGARTQQCLAVKQGVDGILDVARSTFNSTSEAVHSLCAKYREELGFLKLKLLFNNRHGFYICIPEEELKQGPLPPIFVKVVKKGTKVQCSTDELISLNTRNQEAAAECYMRTEQCLEGLTDHIAKEGRLLSLFSESISLLDMMVNSFATLVSTKTVNSYVRPEFTVDGPLVIEAGRHPVLESTSTPDFMPNNTYLAELSNLMIVTGPNMSGKSTYVRQVALMTILAHIGCYVPARFASFRVVDQLFTRLGTGDNLELNASTFMTEMRETAFLMQYASSRSLIVIDELGRGTSTADGLAIAWSCCEFLLEMKAYVIFATHLHGLSDLTKLYPDAHLWHFSVAVSGDRLNFQYVLKGGHNEVSHYGLLLSEAVGLPPELRHKARQVTEKYLQKKELLIESSVLESDCTLHEEYRVANRLMCILHSNPTPENLRKYIRDLQDSIAQKDRPDTRTRRLDS